MPVVLLCHCDGTDGSTTFTDSSNYAHALLALGTASVSTTAPKFGTGSAVFTGGAGANISSSAAADFNLGSGQFTIEAWAYFTSAPTSVHGVVAQFGGSTNLGWFFGCTSGTTAFGFTYSTTGTNTTAVSAAFSPTLSTWYHLAVDRDAANVIRIYVNGTVIASATAAVTIFASTRNCYIGNDANLNRNFPGRLDEVRITIGQAQYGGAFTPPTGPFDGVATAQARAMVLA